MNEAKALQVWIRRIHTWCAFLVRAAMSHAWTDLMTSDVSRCGLFRRKEHILAKINENYLKLPGSYLFSAIGKKVRDFSAANPEAKIIRLGIGDVTQPIAAAVIEALHGAC